MMAPVYQWATSMSKDSEGCISKPLTKSLLVCRSKWAHLPQWPIPCVSHLSERNETFLSAKKSSF